MSTLSRLRCTVGMVVVVLQLTACGSGFTDTRGGGIGGTGLTGDLMEAESAVVRVGGITVRYWSARAA